MAKTVLLHTSNPALQGTWFQMKVLQFGLNELSWCSTGHLEQQFGTTALEQLKDLMVSDSGSLDIKDLGGVTVFLEEACKETTLWVLEPFSC